MITNATTTDLLVFIALQEDGVTVISLSLGV